MTMHRRDVFKAGLAVALAAPMVARAQATRMKFVCDFAYQGNHAVWGLAIDRGLFDKDGLSVSMDRGYGSGDTIVKVASGRPAS